MTTQEIIHHLAERRQRVLDGKVNCIPSPFPRFSRDFVGIEKKKYYCITANTKIILSKSDRFINDMIYFNTVV